MPPLPGPRPDEPTDAELEALADAAVGAVAGRPASGRGVVDEHTARGIDAIVDAIAAARRR